MKEEMEVWLARDENDVLCVYTEKPKKFKDEWDSNFPKSEIYPDNFHSIKWKDDEPTKAKITLIK